jgi:hypothetical protein
MIIWNPRGFHFIKVLEKGHKFNAGYYIAEILGIRAIVPMALN